MEKKIAHLKLHTEYSLLEGVGKIEEYIEKAGKLGIDTLAITGYCNVWSNRIFIKKCKKIWNKTYYRAGSISGWNSIGR